MRDVFRHEMFRRSGVQRFALLLDLRHFRPHLCQLFTYASLGLPHVGKPLPEHLFPDGRVGHQLAQVVSLRQTLARAAHAFEEGLGVVNDHRGTKMAATGIIDLGKDRFIPFQAAHFHRLGGLPGEQRRRELQDRVVALPLVENALHPPEMHGRDIQSVDVAVIAMHPPEQAHGDLVWRANEKQGHDPQSGKVLQYPPPERPGDAPCGDL